METDLAAIYASAAGIGFLHTLLGPDHYVPFVAMSRARGWSLQKTLCITLLCGAGHVLGSVVLGMVGIAAGVALLRIESIEEVRGAVAGWLLIGFGLAYTAWGLWTAMRARTHSHAHAHADGTVHSHVHAHEDDHLHGHESKNPASPGRERTSLTPWILFTVFLFGPCEPLIPLLMYPAAQGKGSTLHVAMVALVFGAVTLITMASVVAVASTGVHRVRSLQSTRYAHALAGLVVLACGVAIELGF